MGRHVGLHAVTLKDSNPYEVIYHVRRWMNMIDDKREIDIQNITQIADDRRVYTTIWYTEEARRDRLIQALRTVHWSVLRCRQPICRGFRRW